VNGDNTLKIRRSKQLRDKAGVSSFRFFTVKIDPAGKAIE